MRTPRCLRMTSGLICLPPEAIPKLDSLASFVSGTCTQVSTPLCSQVPPLLSSSFSLFSGRAGRCPQQPRRTQRAFLTQVLNVSRHNAAIPLPRNTVPFPGMPFLLLHFLLFPPLPSLRIQLQLISPGPVRPGLCPPPVSIASARSYQSIPPIVV